MVEEGLELQGCHMSGQFCAGPFPKCFGVRCLSGQSELHFRLKAAINLDCEQSNHELKSSLAHMCSCQGDTPCWKFQYLVSQNMILNSNHSQLGPSPQRDDASATPAPLRHQLHLPVPLQCRASSRCTLPWSEAQSHDSVNPKCGSYNRFGGVGPLRRPLAQEHAGMAPSTARGPVVPLQLLAWRREAETEAQSTVRRLLTGLHPQAAAKSAGVLSGVLLSPTSEDASLQFRCSRVQSKGPRDSGRASSCGASKHFRGYSEAWQKALAAWPRAMLDERSLLVGSLSGVDAEGCHLFRKLRSGFGLPALLVWDFLATQPAARVLKAADHLPRSQNTPYKKAPSRMAASNPKGFAFPLFLSVM